MIACKEKKTIMAALKIQTDISNMGVYELEELKHKVTLYAKNSVAISMKSETKDTTKQYNHESSVSIFFDDWKDNDLRDEYIQENTEHKRLLRNM